MNFTIEKSSSSGSAISLALQAHASLEGDPAGSACADLQDSRPFKSGTRITPAMMNASAEQRGGALWIRVAGRIDSVHAPEFERSVMPAIEAGDGQIVFEMAEVDHVSSAGLRVFLRAAKRARVHSGPILFHSMRANVREVFELTGLDKLFTFCASVEEVRARLSSHPAA
ncbi:MAG: STAS domain-containing protein [Panacagrimonas sp.]